MNRLLLTIASLLLVMQEQGWTQGTRPNPPGPRPAVVRIGGSSTVYPITQQAMASFYQGGRNRNVRIELSESGTSGGFRQFCDGQLAIANASRPINRNELAKCSSKGIRFVELPIAFDAITVVVNRANSWTRHISIKDLGVLWSRQAQGRIMSWHQVNSAWPDAPIRLCGPGADSGTFDYFNQAVNGDRANSRRDYTASEDDKVLVKCVAKDPNSLGYFGYSYYLANPGKIRALWVLGSKGLVAPSPQSVQSETYVPLSRPLFLYVNDQMLRDQPHTRRFLTSTLQNGIQVVKRARYIPLPSGTYRLVEAKLYRHVLGSAFGGDLTPGMGLSQALQRSLEQTKKPQFR